MFPDLRLALIQMNVGSSKADNLIKAANSISEAAKNGAKVVALPVSRFYSNLFVNRLNKMVPIPVQ